jgi:S-methylmethionine-dependent homocysteine/selenocysteine methylase
MQTDISIREGATGTELLRHGYKMTVPLWSGAACFDVPDLLQEIHEAYIEAGADLITANTFRTQRRVWKKVGRENLVREATIKSIQLAKDARVKCGRPGVLVGGVVGSLEDSYNPDSCPSEKALLTEHEEHVELIASQGVDYFLIPTNSTILEARVILSLARQTKLPCSVSFVPTVSGSLLSGESLEEMLEQIAPLEPHCIMLNCGLDPVATTPMAARLAALYPGSKGIFANGGGEPSGEDGWRFPENYEEDIARYVRFARQWVELGYTTIGGCCGTTPHYIHALAQAL